MPFTSGTLKGQLTAAEIRKLIRGHNKLVSIKIPPKTNRDGLIKLIEDNGYKLDHKKQMISDARKTRPRRQKITLDQAKELTKPKQKTELQKQKQKEKKEEKEIQKKKEVRQIKKEAVKKEKEVQKIKKKDGKDKPKKERVRVLNFPSQKPKKVTIDKSKKPPMNTKKIEPKKVEKKVEKKEEPKKKKIIKKSKPLSKEEELKKTEKTYKENVKEWTKRYNDIRSQYTWKDKKAKQKAIDDKIINEDDEFILFDVKRPTFFDLTLSVLQKKKYNKQGQEDGDGSIRQLVVQYEQYAKKKIKIDSKRYGLKKK